jgi:peptide/nickel transport system permease protein
MAQTDTAVLEQFALRAEKPRIIRVQQSFVNFVRHKPLGAFGGAIVLVLLAMWAFPGFFANHEPNASVLADRNLGPTASHWFGTDSLGRDLYSRIVYGAGTSIKLGFGVVLLSATIATVLGVVSGFFGGVFDLLVQRVVDVGIALPGLIFIILVVTSLQNIEVWLRIVLAVGVISSFGQSRVIRGAAITAKQNQYVEAARVLGATDLRIIFRHILPNVFSVVIIGISIQIGGAVLLESSLSFLGYGVLPPTASWGRMLNEARDAMVRYPHLAIFPGLAIFFTVYSFNMLGDALRDVLDPRLRGAR